MNEEFDYIVVGSGSAGSVIAAKLSEDADIRVLLIEEGGRSDDFIVSMPKGFGKTMGDPARVHYHPASFDRGDGPQHDIWARGKMLGGSSAINGMVWIRGQAEDYDRIADLGNPGWAWSDMAPYFRKLENHKLGADELRGEGGPVTITDNPNKTPLSEAFIAAGAGLGLPVKKDQNRLNQEGIGYLQWNIDEKGRRVSAARAFLEAAKRRPNLRIETEVRVDRVVMEGTRAVGVAGVRGNAPVTFRTRGEVILCAGALGSPRLLQLSGIGPAETLRAAGVPVIVDSPMVGRNMREHCLMSLGFRLRDMRYSQNRSYSGMRLVGNFLRYLLTGTGPLAWGSYEAAAFVRARPESNRPDTQIMFAPFSLEPKPARLSFEKEPGMHVFAYPLRPESEGSTLIVSGDPTAPSAIDIRYLESEYDQKVSIASIRYIRRLMADPALKPFVVGENRPTVDAQSDKEILAAFRRYAIAGYHTCGTVAMGSKYPLDERLRVRGAEGLRVVDCSVFPEMLSGNTNAPTMAMAWRASDLIREDRRAGKR